MFKFIGKSDDSYLIYDSSDMTLDYYSKAEIGKFIKRLGIKISDIKIEENKILTRLPYGIVFLVKSSFEELPVLSQYMENSY